MSMKETKSKEAFKCQVHTFQRDANGTSDGPPKLTSVYIQEDPVPQSRPRARVIGGKPHVYEAKRSREWKALIRQSLKDQLGDESDRTIYEGDRKPVTWGLPVYPSDIPLAASINVFHHRKKAQSTDTWRTKRPDIDNIAKGILDAFNGVLWEDDSQVAYLEIKQCEGTKYPVAWVHVNVCIAGLDYEIPESSFAPNPLFLMRGDIAHKQTIHYSDIPLSDTE